jgi:hypothetical protein
VPSGGVTHPPAAIKAYPTRSSGDTTFVAWLTPGGVQLPFDLNGDQIQGGGGATLYPLPVTPPPTDPAKGLVSLTITDGGKEINVFGSLSRISNVTAVTLHDLQYHAVFTLRGSPSSQTGQTPPVTYPSTTVNTTGQPTQDAQVESSNIGQTIAVLLKPGNGSGTIAHRTFEMTLTPSDLVGPLAGASIKPLAKALRTDPSAFYVNVQTSDGYDPATGAQQDGNFPYGELRGEFSTR